MNSKPSETIALGLDGTQIMIFIRALVWMFGCPFSKTTKPEIEPTRDELESRCDMLMQEWVARRERIGIDAAE